MGVASYNLASSLSLISAQRLLRRLCLHCRSPIHVSINLLKQLGLHPTEASATSSNDFYSANGCERCHKGYWGRIGVFQVMPITSALRDLILQTASPSLIGLQLEKEGVFSLRHAALMQAARGITSLSEVMAHTDLTETWQS
jgi:type IV pilus assembly protein PilB